MSVMSALTPRQQAYYSALRAFGVAHEALLRWLADSQSAQMTDEEYALAYAAAEKLCDHRAAEIALARETERLIEWGRACVPVDKFTTDEYARHREHLDAAFAGGWRCNTLRADAVIRLCLQVSADHH